MLPEGITECRVCGQLTRGLGGGICDECDEEEGTMRRLPAMILDDDWTMIAEALESLAECIRETIERERTADTTTALRDVLSDEKARALLLAAMNYGKPKGWTANAEPIYK